MGEGAGRPISVLWAHLGPCWPLGRRDEVLSRLPPRQAERATRYHRWQDVQAFLLGRLLLTEARKRAGLPTRLDEMTWGRTGRPALPGPGDFNISHAGEIVACAFSMKGAIGIDLDLVRPGMALTDLLPALSLAERGLVLAAPIPLRTALRFWCRKEAIAKAAGSGIAGPSLPDCSSHPVSYAGRQWSVAGGQRGGYAWALAWEAGHARSLTLARYRTES